MKPLLSIIIPTLNESGYLEPLIDRLQYFIPKAEIIVADCGSTDGSIERIAGKAKVVVAGKGRAIQMNAGAKQASADILWFLHADCVPGKEAVNLILSTMKNMEVVGGGFRWELIGSKWYYGICTFLAHLKNRLKKNLFGDMGIFVRRTVFNELDGYAELPICEEIEFTRRLKRMGEIAILNETLPSSDRKLLEEGPMKAFIRNDIIKIAFRLGVSPGFLRKHY